MVTYYEIPKDISLQCRMIQNSKVLLGKVGDGVNKLTLKAHIRVMWIEQLGIMYHDVMLENETKEIQEALADLTEAKAQIVPLIFDAVRESSTIVDDLTMQLHAAAAEIDAIQLVGALWAGNGPLCP